MKKRSGSISVARIVAAAITAVVVIVSIPMFVFAAGEEGSDADNKAFKVESSAFPLAEMPYEETSRMTTAWLIADAAVVLLGGVFVYGSVRREFTVGKEILKHGK